MHRVVITGLGCITPIGNTPQALWQSVLEGRTGIAPMQVEHPGLRFTRMGEVRDFRPEDHLANGQILTTERAAQFAIVAARQAAVESQLLAHHAPDRIAIFTGCSTAGRQAEEPETAKLYTSNARVHPLTVPRSMASSGASQIAIDLHITGPALNLSTACSSGAHAIGLAFQMIRGGAVSAAIAGGHEAPLTFGFLRAWDSIRVVSPTACRPFAADRDGMTLAEGAAYLALETLESAQSRNAPIYAELLGFGMSTDAHHITQPKPEGPAAAIRICLADGKLDPQEIGYINAHGTATQANDQVEAAAIHAVFGDHASRISVSSTKSLHGHSMGASPAIETLITALALRHGQLPFTAGTITPDATLNLNLILEAPQPTGPTVALANSLAFGGLNAILALRTF
ncbi:beta-ketoacyl-[acyl-carrier-protein] synthase family protein [Granulicella tundricola]|uniref:Nodulation protein E n=1 Tax=Granulicella tundricola (strain ATCC BAA-1859 / DSM 23138 / MP5ACTX9) TaxID=1198114 RepID=E8WZW2_GRATM|nr:beta-ketoacyl-[acyl-carrier-protein] synthase family protein [Granulicella tundricola]ADW67773.1 Beta-ketoacyl synthase [Granulicella tundricola MP5ACTX9]